VTEPVVIVGASMGGLRTAEALRRFGYEGAITVFGDEEHAPYNRPPLSKEVLAESVSHDAVAFEMRAAVADVNWVLGTRILSADLDHATVTDHNYDAHPYQALVIATGLRPRRLHVPNNDLRGRHAVRTLDDAIALRAELVPGARVVIVGAGFIGCEVAATARKLGCDVTIVAPGAHPMLRPLGQELAAEMQRRHEEQGVVFLMKREVVDLIGTTTVTGVLVDDGTTIDCDLLVEAIGSHENTEWLDDNDLDTTAGVLTSNNLRAVRSNGTEWENVFAVGDVARFPNPVYDNECRRIEHWNIPTETAKRVGQVFTGQAQGEFRPIPSFWSDQYDNHLLAYGVLSLADEIRLEDGNISGDCVFGYYRDGVMVGVCGIGMRSVVQSYRANFV
jgi:NADPH-dependent 2,4-dienoyl-CoA reductase/sulfur reductase-like enzyme